jgi:hypothetical protein
MRNMLLFDRDREKERFGLGLGAATLPASIREAYPTA